MWGPGYGMMDGWSGYGMGLFGMIVWILVLIAIVAGVVWLVRSVFGSGARPSMLSQGRSSALDILEERYARGDITRDEYVEKKRDLS